MFKSVAASAVLVASCIPFGSHENHQPQLQVPAAFAGSHEVQFHQGVDSAICTFRMYAPGQPDPGGNWVRPGDRINAEHGGRAMIKPGTYMAVAGGCENGFPETTNKVTIGDQDKTLSITYRERVINEPGWVPFFVATPDYILHPKPVQCIPDGGFNAPDTDYPCCSMSSHWSPERDRYVCGPGPGQ